MGEGSEPAQQGGHLGCVDDEVTIETLDALKPCSIDEGDFVYLLMPLRIR